MATFAPSAARRFAMAAPMPRDPPVTSAIFPSSFLVIVFHLLLESRSLLLLRLTASLDVAVPRWQHTLLSWHRCLAGMGGEMELRHLRYFVAIAEAGSMTVAAGRKLHTSQPSLSRQIRDLEEEVGAQLLTRRARGIELTPAGRTFLDHACLVLSQVDAAGEAARRVANPSKPCFTIGFLTGHESTWMPEALRILRHELPNINVMISSQYSPLLADGLSKGKIDAAFLRPEQGAPDLAFRLLVKEPLVVVLPWNHRLGALKAITPQDLVGETFVTVSNTAPVLRGVIDNYLKRSGIKITPAHEADHVTMGMSLIASTRGVGLLPAYAQNFLPSSITSRPLEGDSPSIVLVLSYRKSNQSPILKLLLSRLDELVARVSKKAH